VIGTTGSWILDQHILHNYACAAGMSLHINGKFTMGILKSSLLSLLIIKTLHAWYISLLNSIIILTAVIPRQCWLQNIFFYQGPAGQHNYWGSIRLFFLFSLKYEPCFIGALSYQRRFTIRRWRRRSNWVQTGGSERINKQTSSFCRPDILINRKLILLTPLE
jgi:hypothetical protein